MSITMKDIARELGVSVATVSRALKNSPRISVEQRDRINKFAREHDFVPNVIAESLRNSKTKPQKIIGVKPIFTCLFFPWLFVPGPGLRERPVGDSPSPTPGLPSRPS